jgi:hypothetical protein
MFFLKISEDMYPTNNTSFAPGKNDNVGGGKYINFPEDFLQNDSAVKIVGMCKKGLLALALKRGDHQVKHI